MKQTVLSVRFADPRRAQAACLLLREMGLSCHHQLGPRFAHQAVPCVTASRRVVVPVRPAPPSSHPPAILNIVLPKGQTALVCRLVRNLGGREIRPLPGPTGVPPHMIS